MIRSAAATTEVVRESGKRDGWGMDIAFRPEIDRKELRLSLSLNPVITALSSNCPQRVSEVSECRQSLRRREGEAVIFLRVLCSALLRCFRCRLPPLPPFHISLPVPPPLLFISLPVTEFKRFCMTYMRQKHCSRHAAARSTTIRLGLNKVSVDS